MEKQWAFIFCRFKDIPPINQPKEFFYDFFTSSGKGKGGLYDYWKDISYGTNILSDSKLDFGPDGNWYEMKYTYLNDRVLRRETWIAEAIRLSKIDTAKYHIGVILNATVDAGASGENFVLTIGGAWGQSNWKICNKCRSLVLATSLPGYCHYGGQHVVDKDPKNESIWVYSLALNIPDFPGENNWRYCKKCKGISSDGGVCPGGGKHDRTGTGIYTIATGDPLPLTGDDPNWRRCNKCQGLVHTVQAGKCIAGGDHEYTSQKYCLVGNLEFWLNGTYVDYAVHEMGHCYGLRHADYIKTDDYGDKWNIMGFGWHFQNS